MNLLRHAVSLAPLCAKYGVPYLGVDPPEMPHLAYATAPRPCTPAEAADLAELVVSLATAAPGAEGFSFWWDRLKPTLVASAYPALARELGLTPAADAAAGGVALSAPSAAQPMASPPEVAVPLINAALEWCKDGAKREVLGQSSENGKILLEILRQAYTMSVALHRGAAHAIRSALVLYSMWARGVNMPACLAAHREVYMQHVVVHLAPLFTLENAHGGATAGHGVHSSSTGDLRALAAAASGGGSSSSLLTAGGSGGASSSSSSSSHATTAGMSSSSSSSSSSSHAAGTAQSLASELTPAEVAAELRSICACALAVYRLIASEQYAPPLSQRSWQILLKTLTTVATDLMRPGNLPAPMATLPVALAPPLHALLHSAFLRASPAVTGGVWDALGYVVGRAGGVRVWRRAVVRLARALMRAAYGDAAGAETDTDGKGAGGGSGGPGGGPGSGGDNDARSVFGDGGPILGGLVARHPVLDPEVAAAELPLLSDAEMVAVLEDVGFSAAHGFDLQPPRLPLPDGTRAPFPAIDAASANISPTQRVFQQWDKTLRVLGNPTKLRDPEAFGEAVTCLGEVLGVFYNEGDDQGPDGFGTTRGELVPYALGVAGGSGSGSSSFSSMDGGGGGGMATGPGGGSGAGGMAAGAGAHGPGSSSSSTSSTGTRQRKTFTFSRKKGERATDPSGGGGGGNSGAGVDGDNQQYHPVVHRGRSPSTAAPRASPSKCPPPSLKCTGTLLGVFGPWLFDACAVNDARFVSGRAAAYGALCRLVCRRSDEEISPAMAAAVARILHDGLASPGREVQESILVHADRILSYEFPGSTALVPVLLNAVLAAVLDPERCAADVRFECGFLLFFVCFSRILFAYTHSTHTNTHTHTQTHKQAPPTTHGTCAAALFHAASGASAAAVTPGAAAALDLAAAAADAAAAVVQRQARADGDGRRRHGRGRRRRRRRGRRRGAWWDRARLCGAREHPCHRDGPGDVRGGVDVGFVGRRERFSLIIIISDIFIVVVVVIVVGCPRFIVVGHGGLVGVRGGWCRGRRDRRRSAQLCGGDDPHGVARALVARRGRRWRHGGHVDACHGSPRVHGPAWGRARGRHRARVRPALCARARGPRRDCDPRDRVVAPGAPRRRRLHGHDSQSRRVRADGLHRPLAPEPRRAPGPEPARARGARRAPRRHVLDGRVPLAVALDRHR
jgi:hypothetical protein